MLNKSVTYPGPWQVMRVRWSVGPLLRVNLRREIKQYWLGAPKEPKLLGHQYKRGWRFSF
jgi:hypothetical protein